MSTEEVAGRALVAMDDPVQSVFIEAVLNDIGYGVTIIDQADRAAEHAARSDKYDLVLFDVTLPRLDESGLLGMCTDRWMRLLALAPEQSGGVGFPPGVLVHGMLVAPYNSEDLAQFVDEVGAMRTGQRAKTAPKRDTRVGPIRRWSPTAERDEEPSDMGFHRGSAPTLKPFTDAPTRPDAEQQRTAEPAPVPADEITIAEGTTPAKRVAAHRAATQLNLSLTRFTTMDLRSPKDAMRGSWRASFDALQAATIVMVRLSSLMTTDERRDMIERTRGLYDLLNAALETTTSAGS